METRAGFVDPDLPAVCVLEDAHPHIVLEVLGVFEARALASEDVAEAPNICFVPEVGAQLEGLTRVRVVGQLPKE